MYKPSVTNILKRIKFFVFLLLLINGTIYGSKTIVKAAALELTPEAAPSNEPYQATDEILSPATEVTPTITPELTPIITPEVTQAVTPTLLPSPVPTRKPTPAPTGKPAPTPTRVPEKYKPNTLKLMENYDYIGGSISTVNEKMLSFTSLREAVKNYGKLYGKGMPFNKYVKAMEYTWKDVTDYKKKPVKIKVDIEDTMYYSTYVDILKKLSRYDGVYLYQIGTSTEGRNLYAIEIDVASKTDKEVYMLTGQIHAREFAGGTYITKQFVDLVQKAQTDKKTMDFLKKYKFAAVPIINVDGREALITKPKKWTAKSRELWKAYTNGTDGNRNFPGVQWGQVLNGYTRLKRISDKPNYGFYPGEYAGSNSETRAMMKWLYHYIVVEKAVGYLDLHEQGSIVYAGKSWQTKAQENRCKDLRAGFLSLMNRDKPGRKYIKVSESAGYGLKGEGSSLTDYAISLAVGAKFSPAYGFSVFNYNKRGYMLMEVKDLDNVKGKVKEQNGRFAAITVEIGYGNEYLGNSPNTRRKLKKEYTAYHFDELLRNIPGMMD